MIEDLAGDMGGLKTGVEDLEDLEDFKVGIEDLGRIEAINLFGLP